METSDLLRLIQRIETGDKNFYHCDVRDGIVQGLKELVEKRELIEELKNMLKDE